MKQTTVFVDDFNEGMTSDIRDTTKGIVKLSKHFDLYTRPHSLTPYRSQVEADTNSATDRLTDFLIGQSAILYGGGNDTVSNNIKIWQGSGGTTWTAATGGVSTGNIQMVSGIFVLYHDVIYGGVVSGNIWKYDTLGASFTNNAQTTSGACTAQGVVHSKDDILYMAYTTSGGVPTIASNNNGSWTVSALALPSKYRITSLSEYGNYLAIACKPSLTGQCNSVVYLWDRDSTLTTLSEVIDFGQGDLTVISQIEGELIGVSLRLDTTINIATGLTPRLVFRNYAGARADVFREIIATSATGIQLVSGNKFNANRFYFLAGIEIDTVLHNGVWCISKNSLGRWAVWFDKLPNNDTTIAAGSLTGFFVYGDYALISWNDSGYRLTQTSATSTAFAGTSLIELPLNVAVPAAERTANKQLQVVALAYDPLPSGATATLKYKIDGGSWITIFTEATLGQVVTEDIYDSSNTNFTAGREYQFRIESKGGAIITGLKYKYEVLSTLI